MEPLLNIYPANRDEKILSLYSLAEAFASKYPNHYEDVRQEALLAICYCPDASILEDGYFLYSILSKYGEAV